MAITTAAIATIAKPSKIGIHSGEVTHHHDQVATCPMPASLRVKKIRNKTMPIPRPLDVDFCLFMLFAFMIKINELL